MLLAGLSGALHDYLRERGVSTEGVELRTLMPVNLRDADADEVLGNRSGLMLIELPVGIADPQERLRETHRRVALFTKAYDTQSALGIFSLIGQTRKAVQEQTLRLLAAKTSAVLCHVQGSRQARYLGLRQPELNVIRVVREGSCKKGVGFSGHVTLELSNVATLPIKLYPGMKIGQLCFFQLSSPAEHPYGSAAAGSHYQGQRGPTPSRSHLGFSRTQLPS